MAEYIERDLTVQKILEVGIDNYQDKYPNIGMVHAANIVKYMPAADVAPVVHAQWEKISEPDEDGNVWYRCPICQHNDKQSPGIDVPHCWYCGARMDRNG